MNRPMPLTAALSARTPAPDARLPAPAAGGATLAYREAGAWQTGQPALPERWWRLGDPVLDALEAQLVVDNQKQALAASDQGRVAARAAVARPAAWPSRGPTPAPARRQRHDRASGGRSPTVYAVAQSRGKLGSWAWCAVALPPPQWWMPPERPRPSATLAAPACRRRPRWRRRTSAARRRGAGGAARCAASQAYERFLQLTRNRREAGVASTLDVAQAETQLNSAPRRWTQAWSRAQFEHALATLVGEAAAGCSDCRCGPRRCGTAGAALLPSTTLERVTTSPPPSAGGRQRARSAWLEAAWFPVLDLHASGGYRGSDAIAHLISLPNPFWSIGPALALSLFDGGARSAALRAGAGQRRTGGGHLPAEPRRAAGSGRQPRRRPACWRPGRQQAAARPRRAREIADNQYRAGIVAALNVITAQTSELNAEKRGSRCGARRMAAATQLLKEHRRPGMAGGRRVKSAVAVRHLRYQRNSLGPEQGACHRWNGIAGEVPGGEEWCRHLRAVQRIDRRRHHAGRGDPHAAPARMGCVGASPFIAHKVPTSTGSESSAINPGHYGPGLASNSSACVPAPRSPARSRHRQTTAIGATSANGVCPSRAPGRAEACRGDERRPARQTGKRQFQPEHR